LVIAGITLGAILAAGAVWQLRYATELFLTARLRHDLAEQPAERAPDTLRAALELGAPGQALVVQCLSDPRGAIADSALLLLLDRIELWQSGDMAAGPRRLRGLADELASACPHLDTAGRLRAGRLARQILLAAPTLGAESAPLVASCELVLRASMFASAVKAEPTGGRWTLKSVDGGEPALASRGNGRDASLRPADPPAAEPAGSGLDYEPYRPGLPRYGQAGSERVSLPAPRASAPATRTLTWSGAPPSRGIDPPGAAVEPRDDGGPSPASGEPPAPASHADPTSTIDWMRRLHGDAASERTARRELTARGFGQLEIELARRLTDDDPEVRRQMAEWLPRLPGIDARPWLLWLSDDSSPRVRMLAATLMSTSSDPALLERVAAMYRSDPDGEVRRQAGQRQPKPGR
jgi:hypothetical protein